MSEQLALITGASSGIGLSLAKELATRGYDVAICSAGDRLHDAAESLQGTGVSQGQPHGPRGTVAGVKKGMYGEKIATPPGPNRQAHAAKQ